MKNISLFLSLILLGSFSTAQTPKKQIPTDSIHSIKVRKPADTTSIITGPVLFAEVMPEFPGGQSAMMNFISKNVKIPTSGAKGTVFVSFVVSPSGQITDPKIIRDIGGDCGEEVLRVLKMMPAWKPGLTSNKPIPVQYTLPIRFQ